MRFGAIAAILADAAKQPHPKYWFGRTWIRIEGGAGVVVGQRDGHDVLTDGKLSCMPLGPSYLGRSGYTFMRRERVWGRFRCRAKGSSHVAFRRLQWTRLNDGPVRFEMTATPSGVPRVTRVVFA